jgi:hypothetical protein
MITCFLQGGLGNQLFQIATTTALALRNNDFACFDIDGHRIGLQGRNASNYKTNIYRNLLDHKLDTDIIFNQNGHHYEEIPYQENLKLIGYFQSEKYFEDYKEYILKLFEPTEEILQYINEKYGDILNKNTCSINVRHGDYLRFPNHHPICSMEYYETAISHFNGTTFLVFSDNINWCKNNFIGDNFIFIEGEKDYVDLYLISMCKNNIIANSSFSWWGSWLNKNENKKIIAPSVWFGHALSNLNTNDTYTDKMIKI